MLSSFESRIVQLMIYMKVKGCYCSHDCESMTNGLYANHRCQGHPIEQDVLTHDVK